MSKKLFTFLFITYSCFCFGQNADSLYKIGREFENKNPDSSAKYFEKALRIYNKGNDHLRLAACYSHLSEVYSTLGKYKKAGECDLEGIRILEKLKDTSNLIICYGNFATHLNEMRMQDEALRYARMGIDFALRTKNYNKLLPVYLTVADVYSQNGNHDSSIYYLTRTYDIARSMHDTELVLTALGNLGNAYYNYGQNNGNKAYIRKALSYAIESIDPKYPVLDSGDWAFSKGLIGACEAELENYDRAESAYLEAEKYFENRDLFQLNTVYQEMMILYIKANKNGKALKYFSKFEETYKKILSQENVSATTEMQTKYETQKKEQENKFLNAQNELANQNLGQQKLITYLMIAGLLISLGFGFIAYRNYKQKEKANILISEQKKQVEIQKHLIEEKQREILDSITYAKRLQDAILPPEDLIRKSLPDTFILYKPKDIVAGDFYWMEVKNDLIFIAAADCTGHGVPGAMVSVVCSGALNRSVNEFGLMKTGEILDKTRELVVETFMKSDGDVKDGMDISLLSINIKTREVNWSGANNPLWYFKSGKLNELTAHKQPIGKYADQTPFPTINVNVNKGDVLYLFTDGYADQFGGPKGKKFKFKQLSDLLLNIHSISVIEQKKTLNQRFEKWKGNLEQVDDVCIIGIKL